MINVVLFEPEIPQNTGNISRTCVGFNCVLHLIKPYGFILDDKKMKRAGLDYWDNLKLIEYDSWEEFEIKNNINQNNNNIFLLSKKANKWIEEVNYKNVNLDSVYFVFGKETKGLPESIMNKYQKQIYKIDMGDNIRSFNLSNCVAMIVYDYNKQIKFKNN